MNKFVLLIFVLLSTSSFSQNKERFSHDAGFYDTPFYLNIDTSDGRVLYSYQNNINRRSKVYRDSILIDKNTTISFALYQNDSVIKLGSRSYFINFKTKFDVVSLTISEKALYDSISGIYMDGPNAYYDTVLKVMLNSNYSKKMEREVFVELFDTSGVRILNQDAGIRIFGGMTIYYPEKSLRLISRNKYGSSRFNADIFGQGKKKYKQIILRHSGNDYRKTRFRDILSTTLAAEAGLDVQANSPSHLFVNSEYWGVYNIREKINEFYIDNNYDCGKEGVDLLQAYNFVEEGDNVEYNHLLDYVDENNLKREEHYEYVKTLMDVKNFANYWIYQIYFGNTDARGNIRFWRSDSLDGKFRWIIYDTDLGWGNYRSTLLEDLTSPVKTKWYNPTWSTFLLRNMFKNKEFKDYFINQTSYLLSTSLSTLRVKEKISYFENRYNDEMIYHFENRKRFQSNQSSYKRWKKEINQLNFYALKRDGVLFSQLIKKFDLSDSYSLKVIINNPQNGKVLINNNVIKTDSFICSFFYSIDVPIYVHPNLGYSYSGSNQNYIVNKLEKEITIQIEFTPNKESEYHLIINEIDYVNDCVEIFNQEGKSINLNNFKLVDKNNNSCTISDINLETGGFMVFHRYKIEKLDSVAYQKIDFKISSTNECIALYDDKGNFVDSIHYKLDEVEDSYSRNIPFEKVEETTVVWRNNSDVTMGYHNQSYSELMVSIQDREKRNSIILYSGISIIVLMICYFLYRRKRSTSKS